MTRTADYAKSRRDAARAAGRCLVCCKRQKLAGKSVCEHCEKLKAQWYSCSPNRFQHSAKPQRGPDLFNVCCQAHGFHRDGCKAHAPAKEKAA